MRTTNDVTPGIYSVSEIPNCKANDIFVCSVAKKWDKKPILLELPIKITNF